MRLSTICESRTDRQPGAAVSGRSVPKSAEEAEALFFQGLEYMDAGRDEEAYASFGAVAEYSVGHPDLLGAARDCRDFLDPDRSPKGKAEVLARVFTPGLMRVEFGDPADGRATT
jgi:hypothetical protein